MARYIRNHIIIKANKRDIVNKALEEIGWGADNFSVPLVPTTQGQGTPPATHYACSWAISDGQKAKLMEILDGLKVTAKFHLGKSFDEELAAEGSKKMTTESG